eukprot:CAMPEP_0203757342 /NCGR_PEP_ID=MMETSP0098-20131031/10450_1 /ASSEMBLY_ACC=CAM_ASM_000208 /TAXON_ID=96639 /ORGANISM=" , Strain NY0313808BC1" /LENGTH=424 /DNA_ID=CAMNT_0050649547 /DNA_START=384 /DNA_END=1658 /DNA_ORIENTATION=+
MTGCPFPRTYSNENLEKLKQNPDMQFNKELCVQTFADFYGIPWIVFQAVIGLFALFMLALCVRRLIKLRHYAALLNRPYMSFAQAKVYCCAFTLSFCLVVEMVDPGCFRGYLPAPVYFLLDECMAATTVILALVIVDFWAMCAKGMRRGETGLPKGVFTTMSVLLFCNFVGFELAGMLLPDHYFFFEGIKSAVATLLIISIGVVAWVNMRSIEASFLSLTPDLEDEQTTSPIVVTIPEETNEPTENAGQTTRCFRCKARKKTKNPQKVLVIRLRRKLAQFCVVLALGVAVMLSDSIISFTQTTQSWQYDVFDYAGVAILVGIKVLYSLAIALSLHFFRVPTNKPDEMITSNRRTTKLPTESAAQVKTSDSRSAYPVHAVSVKPNDKTSAARSSTSAESDRHASVEFVSTTGTDDENRNNGNCVN